MDWITVLRWLQSDFINRLSSGSLLHCENEGQHSELTVISGTRLNALRNFCWRMAEKYKRVSPVRDVFTSFLKGKLGEELVKERLSGFITEVDYEQHLGGDGNVDFTLTANPLIGVEVKSRCGTFDTVRWSVTSEEVAKNAVIVCVLIQEKINEAQSEYNLVLAGFLPTAMIKLKTGKISFGIEQLMYGGGLVSYLEQLLSTRPDSNFGSGFSSASYHSNRDKLPVYQYISSDDQGKYEHEESDSQQNPDKLVLLYIQNGDDSVQRANYEAAIIAYNGALKLDGNNPEIYYRIATAKYQFGDYEGAIIDCQQAVNINPNYLKAYQKSGLARYQIGDCEGAIVDFTQAIRINPHDAFAYLNRAYARSHLGDNQGAIEDYTQAIKLNPDANNGNNLQQEIIPTTTDEETFDTSSEYINRGNLRYDTGDYQGAVADYTEAIKINISLSIYDADVYFNRANARYDSGDRKGAVEDYSQAIKINPIDAEAYFHRGNLHYELGDKQSAVDDLKKAVDLYHREGKLVEYRNAREQIIDIEIEESLNNLNF